MCLAIPAKIEAIYDTDGVLMGRADFGGVQKEICLAYLPEIRVGEYAIVHVGFALSRIDEQAAKESLEAIASAGLLDSD